MHIMRFKRTCWYCSKQQHTKQIRDVFQTHFPFISHKYLFRVRVAGNTTFLRARFCYPLSLFTRCVCLSLWGTIPYLCYDVVFGRHRRCRRRRCHHRTARSNIRYAFSQFYGCNICNIYLRKYIVSVKPSYCFTCTEWGFEWGLKGGFCTRVHATQFLSLFRCVCCDRYYVANVKGIRVHLWRDIELARSLEWGFVNRDETAEVLLVRAWSLQLRATRRATYFR